MRQVLEILELPPKIPPAIPHSTSAPYRARHILTQRCAQSNIARPPAESPCPAYPRSQVSAHESWKRRPANRRRGSPRMSQRSSLAESLRVFFGSDPPCPDHARKMAEGTSVREYPLKSKRFLPY